MRYLLLCLTLLVFGTVQCSKSDPGPAFPDGFIRGADLSYLPLLESRLLTFTDPAGQVNDLLSILSQQGLNTVRIRLWKDPSDATSSLQEVTAFAQRIRERGLKVWLRVHYSDSWADPGQQTLPAAWVGAGFPALLDSVSEYTSTILQAIRPDIIQIGNEINDGILWPHGRLSVQPDSCVAILEAAIQAVRTHSPDTRIMLHHAGTQTATWFLDQMTTLDYDMIGISYYPWWHGQDLNAFQQSLANIRQTYNKEVIIAETAYPFTLDWNDWTNNIVGAGSQLILPDYPATPSGQQDFLIRIKEMVHDAGGIGFCYWGGEWIAFNGPQSVNGSPWENMALFDFQRKALPGVSAFR